MRVKVESLRPGDLIRRAWTSDDESDLASAASSTHRTEVISTLRSAVGGLDFSWRATLARLAARVRWARVREIETAQDAPEAVRRLLKTYDPKQLRWDLANDRYAVVCEILVRGDDDARRWLRGVLPRKQIRELVRSFRGAGCSETERVQLRKALRLSVREIPKRPHKPALWVES
jgi:hypothetical protein